MSDIDEKTTKLENPYKLVDHTREKRKGVIAGSLNELMSLARQRFNIPNESNITIVLEQDGTEIDDEEYFATIEKDTNLMVLYDNQKWSMASTRISSPQVIVVDDTDHSIKNSIDNKNNGSKCRHIKINSLVSSLHNEPSHISHLAGTDLELLSDMDPDSLADIASERSFLETLREASGRFLAEKRKNQDSIALLQMLSSSSGSKKYE